MEIRIGHRSPHGDVGLILITAKSRSGIEQGEPLMEMQKSDGSRLSCCVPDFKRKASKVSTFRL